MLMLRGSSVNRMISRTRKWTPMRRRALVRFVVAFICSFVFLYFLSTPIRNGAAYTMHRPWMTDLDGHFSADPAAGSTEDPGKHFALHDKAIHIIMPATQSNVHFCKTLLTLAILGYPSPHIVAWGEDDETAKLLGGGSHYAKITKTLDYINNKARRKVPGFDDQLLFMIDSYDIWFQLPANVLIQRYHEIVKEENKRVSHRMGSAYAREGIFSDVIFGGGKRCSPNEIHTLACYPTPESPLPMDVYGANTDTINGRNMFTSARTRYLNSGYLIGPVKKVRPLLERALQKLEECRERRHAWFDNGSWGSDLCYHGSDQSIFVEMFGEQEFHRESMRRHHRTWLIDSVLDKFIDGRAGSKPPLTQITGVPIDDMLNPSITHQKNDEKYSPGKPFEFGIGIDYWSALGHQTSNAESDHRYIVHDQPLEPQIGDQGMFDCPAKAFMPKDLSNGKLDLLGTGEPTRWDSVPLYSEICVGAIPVMIHHNSVDKSQREKQWDKTWWNGRARQLVDARREQGSSQILTKGVTTDSGDLMTFEELCPQDMEQELFRDVQ